MESRPCRARSRQGRRRGPRGPKADASSLHVERGIPGRKTQAAGCVTAVGACGACSSVRHRPPDRDIARIEAAVERGGSGESRSRRPCHRTSVRANTSLVHAPVRPWSPSWQRRRRGPKSARTSALRVPAATSDADRRRRRSPRSSQSTSKAGSRLGRSLSIPFRRMSNGSCGHTLHVASSASDSVGHHVLRAGRALSWPPG